MNVKPRLRQVTEHGFPGWECITATRRAYADTPKNAYDLCVHGRLMNSVLLKPGMGLYVSGRYPSMPLLWTNYA
jgi:hypothetical protein